MAARSFKIALIVWVGAVLVLPLAGYALGFRGKNIDNRTLAKGPAWSLHTLTHSSSWHHAADAFSDHMPLRDHAIRWRAETEFNFFRDSPRPDLVIVGRDHWLFLQEEFDTCSLYPTITPVQVAQALDLAHAAAAASGRELFTMLMPAKSTIEADHYRSSTYTFEACPRAREQKLEQLMRAVPGSIDLWRALRTAKRGGDDLWIPNDSHTDTAGSIAIARALVQAVRPRAWQDGLEQNGAPFRYIGDLDVLAGITDTRARHALVTHGLPKRPIRSHLLAFGDSQLAVSDPEIAPYFPDRQEVGIDELLAGSIPAEKIRAAHLIVVESVQRTAYARVGLYLYPLPLIDAFLPDIGHRLPVRYGTTTRSTNAQLALPPGVTNTPLRAPHDDVRMWRLLTFKVLDARSPLNVALLDTQGRPRTSPESARGALPSGFRVALAVPPGIPIDQLQLSVAAPAGARLSPIKVAPLERTPRRRARKISP